MSNRSLIEINHDFAPKADPEHLEGWAERWLDFIRSGDANNLPQGVTLLWERHHSQGCPVQTLRNIRALGWTVAVHNDYAIGRGKTARQMTFWLFTNAATGQFVRGEGLDDATACHAALEQIMKLRNAAAQDVLKKAEVAAKVAEARIEQPTKAQPWALERARRIPLDIDQMSVSPLNIEATYEAIAGAITEASKARGDMIAALKLAHDHITVQVNVDLRSGCPVPPDGKLPDRIRCDPDKLRLVEDGEYALKIIDKALQKAEGFRA